MFWEWFKANMIVIGLTGSIGMGKTTAAGMLRSFKLPVCDSDALVHGFLGKGGAAVDRVSCAFRGVSRGGAIDRNALGRLVFGNQEELKKLETILHPMVKAAQFKFLRRCQATRVKLAVLDVPLLFEVGTNKLCDVVIVVSAPPFLQEQRVLGRPGMTKKRLSAALDRQLSNEEKCRSADFVVQTGANKRDTMNRLGEIVRGLCSK